MFRLTRSTVPLVLFAPLLAACLPTYTKVTIQSYQASPQRLNRDQAFNAVTSALVARGFDIKASNKDAGLVSTEYKKIASSGDSPPFDYYLQLRVTLPQASDSKPIIRITPMVKEQNRMNAAAFSEHELEYIYQGTAAEAPPVTQQGRGQMSWRDQCRIAFQNVISDLTSAFGISDTDWKIETTRTSKSLLSK